MRNTDQYYENRAGNIFDITIDIDKLQNLIISLNLIPTFLISSLLAPTTMAPTKKKKPELEYELEKKVEQLEKQLEQAQDEVKSLQEKQDAPSIVSTSASSTLGPVSHKGYLFRWLVS